MFIKSLATCPNRMVNDKIFLLLKQDYFVKATFMHVKNGIIYPYLKISYCNWKPNQVTRSDTLIKKKKNYLIIVY